MLTCSDSPVWKTMFFMVAAALVLSAVLTSSLSAMQFKGGKDIYISEDIDEDFFVAGSSINFDARGRGDLAAFAQTVTFDGDLDGNVMTFSQYSTIGGTIDRSVRSFSQFVTINATVDGDLLAFAQRAIISANALVGRDCVINGGDVSVDGAILGGLRVSADQVHISGKIDGDVTIDCDNISILPQAVIGGDLIYRSKEKADIAPEAQIIGDTKWKRERESSSSGTLGFLSPSLGWLWSFFFFCGSFIIGVILILFKRELVNGVVTEIRSKFAIQGLLGLLIIFLGPVLLILIGVSIVGIPVMMLGVFFYGILFLVSKIFVGIALGVILISLIKKEGKVSLGWSLFLGLLLLSLSFKIPVLGWVIYFIAWAVGAGAIAICFFRRKPKAHEAEA